MRVWGIDMNCQRALLLGVAILGMFSAVALLATNFQLYEDSANRNRTAGEVRSYFTKAGGALAETGAVSFMFDRVGLIEFDRKVASENAVMEAALEAGADDVSSNEDSHEVITSVEGLRDVAKTLEAKFGNSKKAALIWRPQNMIAVDDEAGEKILKLIGSLEDNDDVQNVYVNAEFSDALVAKMSG